METDDKFVIWDVTVDNKTWLVRVLDDGYYRGKLQIIRVETDELIYEESVGLSYGAVFGPDIADVEEWMRKSLEIIDSR